MSFHGHNRVCIASSLLLVRKYFSREAIAQYFSIMKYVTGTWKKVLLRCEFFKFGGSCNIIFLKYFSIRFFKKKPIVSGQIQSTYMYAWHWAATKFFKYINFSLQKLYLVWRWRRSCRYLTILQHWFSSYYNFHQHIGIIKSSVSKFQPLTLLQVFYRY